MQNILIVGATSAIAEATARIYAGRGDRLYLLGRNRDQLENVARDLSIRGASVVNSAYFDAANYDSHSNAVEAAFQTLGTIDVTLIAHGSLPNQIECQRDFRETLVEFEINAIGTISILTHLANNLERQQFGSVAIVTSVAGDRGRKSNYVYGAAKGMVSVFLQGLRARLYESNIIVIDVKPGFVDTPMTKDLEKGALWTVPEIVARDIVKGIERRKYDVYTPAFWRVVMIVIRNIPESIFKRMNL